MPAWPAVATEACVAVVAGLFFALSSSSRRNLFMSSFSAADHFGVGGVGGADGVEGAGEIAGEGDTLVSGRAGLVIAGGGGAAGRDGTAGGTAGGASCGTAFSVGRASVASIRVAAGRLGGGGGLGANSGANKMATCRISEAASAR